jgi:hypothetical protein
VKRAVNFVVVAAIVVGLSVLFAVTRGREPMTFRVELGTERTFPAHELTPGDRFGCVGGGILPRQGPGFGADASDGTFIGTDEEGNVTVRCPEYLGEL